MIVLRLTVQGLAQEARSPAPRVVLGDAPDADVRVDGAGWRTVEAVLEHAGTEIRLERPDGSVLRLRVGDEIQLGGARLALVGLLPRPPQPAPSPPVPQVFGDYPESAWAAKRFELEGEAPAAPSPETVHEPTARGTSPPPPARGPAKRTLQAAPAAPSPPVPPPPAPPPRSPSPAFRTPTFGEELVRQLRRTPYLTISLAAHVLAFFLLSLITTSPASPSREAQEVALRSSVLETDEEEGQRGDEELPAEMTALPEPEFEPSPEPRVPDPERPDLASVDDPALTLDPLPTGDAPPLLVGLHPTLSAVTQRDPRRQPAVPKEELARPYLKGDMGWANAKAAELIRADLGRGSGRRGDPFATLSPDDLLVVEGSFDHIQDVLKVLRLPCDIATPIGLSWDTDPQLSTRKVIFWNCGESLPSNRQAIVARRLQLFVRDGGYLFTTDWSIGNILAHAFPDLLVTTGNDAPLPEAVVNIAPARGQAEHPLLEGVFHPGVPGKWWLERASFDIKVVDRSKVTVLIESEDLEKTYRRSPSVAVTFSYGKGRVLHMAGHYYQEMGNLAGTISAQRLALNFILERLERKDLGRRRP